MRLSWFRRINYFDLMRGENRKIVASYETLVAALNNEITAKDRLIAAQKALLDQREKMIALLKGEPAP